MSKTLTSREFDALVQRIERMAEGIAKHKGEPDFPSRLKEPELRESRQKLEDFRQNYENLAREAERAYDAYAAHYSICEAEMSKDDDMVRGFYGKTNPVLADFGTKVFSKPPGRTKKSAPSA